MSKHTPGPWFLQGRLVLAEVGGQEVRVAAAKLYVVPNPKSPAKTFADVEQSEANARLIAAAPQLLDRLKALVAAVKRGEVLEHHVTSADAAIADVEKGVAE